MMIERDPEYDFTPPLPKPGQIVQQPKGRQCGECGMKFEYGQSYGYCCQNTRCPTGWNIDRSRWPWTTMASPIRLREIVRVGKDSVAMPRELTDEQADAAMLATAVWLDIKGSQLTVNREKTKMRYRALVKFIEAGNG